jgi:histidyl-tRNA synthetase
LKRITGKEGLEGNEKALNALGNLSEIVKLSMEGGVTAAVSVDLGFARGLEYYTGMIFEVFVPT